MAKGTCRTFGRCVDIYDYTNQKGTKIMRKGIMLMDNGVEADCQ